MCSFQEMFLLCPYEEIYSHFKLLINFLILCQIVLHPNINFLTSKQNLTPNIYPKIIEMLKK